MVVTLAWTSDASGNMNGIPTDFLAGELLRCVFTPGSGGSEPTDGYDAELLDSNGVDLLAGEGASLSHTSTTSICPAVEMTDGSHPTCRPFVFNDKLQLEISGAGNGKSGLVVLYVR